MFQYLDLIVLHYPETYKEESTVPITIQGKIENLFCTIDEDAWKYAFSERKDFDLLIGLLALHFESKEVKLPTANIPLASSEALN